ncbi:type I DNA topoisomerase [Mycoplasmatota bacterium WC30]
MAKKLVIVESPAKSKTIGQYLGEDYIVQSSVGHVRDLAVVGAGGLGVDVENDFKPTYEVLADKKKVIHTLNKSLKEVDEVYLATDPDREGEAISWHLSETLNIKDQKTYRVIFNEITRKAVNEAFVHPGEINKDLVNSQETRRILDRIIGFKLSKLLQSKIKSKSAGRVQSATLKIIVDRETEINNFTVEEYYEMFAEFDGLEAKLFKLDGKEPKISTKEFSNEILESLNKEFDVESLDTKPNTLNPKPAFITSTLQQMASSKYGFSPTRTMKSAQILYEGVELENETEGLITYMRTDSIRLSETFISEAKQFVIDNYGAKYYGNMRKTNKKQNVQDAHEAIRPTSIHRTPESVKKYLSASEFKIYQLIYIRALASLMKAKKTETTALVLKNNRTIFRVTSTKKVFDGYSKVYQVLDTENGIKEIDLSKYKVGDKIIPTKVYDKQLFTSPPARYTEARLIKEMEDLGIGRPSTYAQTILTIKNRKYVELKEKKFTPTEQGMLTIKKLDKYFHEFVSPNYSRDMEVTLDGVAEGKEERVNVLTDFYQYFMPLIANANKNMSKVEAKPTGETCPECGLPMVFRIGKYGDFEACSGFPNCKYIKQNEKSNKPEVYDTKVKCPSCKDGTLVLRTAKKGKNKGNQFLASSNFPKCKYISPLKVDKERCPDCGNVLVINETGETYCIDEKCGFKK